MEKLEVTKVSLRERYKFRIYSPEYSWPYEGDSSQVSLTVEVDGQPAASVEASIGFPPRVEVNMIASEMSDDQRFPKDITEACTQLCKPEKNDHHQNTQVIEAFLVNLKACPGLHSRTVGILLPISRMPH